MSDKLADRVPDFYQLTPTEQIAALGWYLHSKGIDTFTYADLRQGFRSAHAEAPDVTVYAPRMASRRPPILVKGRTGFRLSGDVRRELEQRYGTHPTTVAVTHLLASLPDKVPSVAEKAFLVEAIDCYRARAFRAAIVMAWNLAFDHLRVWIMADPSRLAAFNGALQDRFHKKHPPPIAKIEDFDEYKESEVIECCRASKIAAKNTCDILREKLVRRNLAAHPSSVLITQHQADDAITDLVNNVVLFLQ